MGNTITVNGLTYKINDKNILNNMELEIESNKLYTIVGPNGSGKTTLIKHICKIIQCKSGEINIGDIDINSINSRELGKIMSSVPQNTNLDFAYTAWDIVLMGRNPHIGRFKKENDNDLEKVREAMKMTNTYHLKDEDISTLSGGERQRVIIARALAQETPMMILDEPISQLDIHHQIQVMNILKSLVKDYNKTVICVLHDLNIAAQYSDELILVNDGKVLKKGTPKEIINNEVLKEVYNMDFFIMDNPINSCPLILPFNKEK